MPDVVWNTAASGLWTDGADWSGGTYPNAPQDDVTIGTQGAYAVTLATGSSYEIGALLVSNTGAELLLDGSLAMAGSLENEGQIRFDNGTINDQGAIYNAGWFSGFGDVYFFSLDNTGTISTDGTVGDDVYLGGYSGATIDNTGVLEATGNVLELGGVNLLNLADGTLSGGTYIATTGSGGFWGWIEWFGGNASTISEDNASITLSGGSDIGAWVSSADTLTGIEQTLDSIGSAGTLALEQGDEYYDVYSYAQSISLSGLLVLDASSFAAPGLVITAGGTLLAEGSSSGWDYVSGPIQSDGLIAAATGSVLFLDGALQGDVSIAAGATIEASGGSVAGTFSNDGFLVDSGGTLYVTTVAGVGGIALEGGSTLFVANLGSASVIFGSADAAIVMPAFAGTIANFGPTNSVIVTGRTGDSLALNGDELSLMNGSSSAGSLTIEGSLPAFSITSYNGSETITATPPAQSSANPGPAYFNDAVSLNDTSDVGAAGAATLVSALDYALGLYADHVYGLGTLTVELNLGSAGNNPDQLANGGFEYVVPTGTVINGNMLYEAPADFELTTGQQYEADLPDIIINVPALSLDRVLQAAEDVSLSAANYAVEIFEHELTHGFGFVSLIDPITGTYSGAIDEWDANLSFASNGLFFIGPAAEAVNGGPVTITTLTSEGEQYSHLANSDSDPNADDLMSGLGLTPGATISALDLAILQDIGVPVVNPVQTACYAAGTRIATAAGEVKVEHLAIGDLVETLHAGLQKIKWIGRRSYAGRFIAGNKDILPIRIARGAIEEEIPARDLFVSPGHAVCIDAALIHAFRLVNGVSITQSGFVESLTYYHIETENHEIIFAENCPAETFFDEDFRAQFQNAAQFRALYPGQTAARIACLPRLEDGFLLHAIQQRLNTRAGILPPPATHGALRGYVDQPGPIFCSGWAQDSENPESPVCLDIMVDGTRVTRLLANLYRADLRQAGLGSGCHAFRATLPSSRTGRLEIRRAADGVELPWTEAALAQAA